MPGIQPLVGAQITMPLDDLQATSATTLPQGWGKAGFTDSVTMLDTFESVEGYELVKAVSATGDPGALSRAPAPEGREGSVARLSFLRGRGGSPVVAFRPVHDSRPLPIVVNQRFLDDRDHKVGDEFPAFVNGQYITVHIAGAFDLFPGYDPDTSEDLFVADGARFLAVATRMPGAGSNVYPNEVWMGDRGTLPLDKEAMRDKGLSVEQIFVRQDILAEQSSDPLIAASWEGILFISFGAVLLVSALGFITYSGIGAVGRSLEFAILRTMGLSGRQIFGVVTFEQAFVVLAGVAAGTLLGFPLSRLMISYMGLTERGKDPLPPLISVVSWQSVITVYLLLTLVVASTVVALVALYSRLAVSRALRMGEL
jgi:putative ABC transport system permease protein